MSAFASLWTLDAGGQYWPLLATTLFQRQEAVLFHSQFSSRKKVYEEGKRSGDGVSSGPIQDPGPCPHHIEMMTDERSQMTQYNRAKHETPSAHLHLETITGFCDISSAGLNRTAMTVIPPVHLASGDYGNTGGIPCPGGPTHVACSMYATPLAYMLHNVVPL